MRDLYDFEITATAWISEARFCAFERNVLRRIYGPVTAAAFWSYALYLKGLLQKNNKNNTLENGRWKRRAKEDLQYPYWYGRAEISQIPQKIFRACKKQRSAFRIISRFRSQERSCDRSHDNVACNLGEDCDLTGKKGLVLGAFICCDEMKLSPSAQKFNECTGCKISDFLNDLCTPMKLGNSVTFTNLDPEYFNVCVVSVGKEEVGYNRIEELDECKENIRVAAGVGARKLRETGVTHINFDGMGHPESAAEGAQLGVWRYQDFKCKDDQIKIASVDLYGDDDKEAWLRGIFKAEAQNIARRLSDCPANCMTPAIFAQTAIDILCPCGVQIEVRDKDWLETKKMNAFLAVAKGSCEPPVFLELGYCGGAVDEKPIVLIGKGVTFDSGGLCLSTCRGMDEYRADMAGAAVVVGVIKAAASMSLPINIRGLIPLCENMPSGMALKPGDVVHSMAGKTILVQDTGHEGRLCIADAMTYGQIEYKPRMMIDIATLTIGMKKALGAGATGVFANDEDIWKEMQKAGSITGDRVWRFPLWQHFTDKIINFPEVDLHNVGLGVGGQPCLGAAFLQEFVCVDWLHLDISGTGMLSHGEEIPYLPKGRMTGRPTRTIIQFLYQIACLGNKGEDD